MKLHDVSFCVLQWLCMRRGCSMPMFCEVLSGECYSPVQDCSAVVCASLNVRASIFCPTWPRELPACFLCHYRIVECGRKLFRSCFDNVAFTGQTLALCLEALFLSCCRVWLSLESCACLGPDSVIRGRHCRQVIKRHGTVPKNSTPRSY